MSFYLGEVVLLIYKTSHSSPLFTVSKEQSVRAGSYPRSGFPSECSTYTNALYNGVQRYAFILDFTPLELHIDSETSLIAMVFHLLTLQFRFRLPDSDSRTPNPCIQVPDSGLRFRKICLHLQRYRTR